MALPFPDNRFDVATMALVIFFVPDPAKGVAEMARVVLPGGTIAAYAWDMVGGGGFPLDPIQIEMRAMGHTPLRPPNAEVSRLDALEKLWTGAGLTAVETREIEVKRTFAEFDDFWATSQLAGTVGPVIAAMAAGDVEELKSRVRKNLLADAAGRITYEAWANAIKGRVPK